MKYNRFSLKKALSNIIAESFLYEEIDYLVKSLNEITTRHKNINNIDSYKEAVKEIISFLKENGFVILGRGATRVVFHRAQDSYVIKVSDVLHKGLHTPNKSEIEVSTGVHGIDAIDIVPKTIEYDKVYSENSIWLITEKVQILSLMHQGDIEKLFPTVAKIYKNYIMDDISINIEDILVRLIQYCKQSKFYMMSTKEFLRLFSYVAYNVGNKEDVDIEYLRSVVVTHDCPDILRLLRCMKYIQTNDLHAGNIGATLGSEVGPEHFVILDFDYGV
jgi:hypothetical protein